MRSLDRCQVCGVGRMKTYCTRTVGSSRLRYMKCNSCFTKGQEALKADELGRSILAECTLRSTHIAHNRTDHR